MVHINKTKQMELATLIVVVLLGVLCIIGTIQIIRILFTPFLREKYRNIIKGAYERPEKYVSKKNKTRKIKKNYL